MIELYSGKREFFWDEYLIDQEKTTAFCRPMQPVKKECCYSFEIGDEASFSISYPQLLKDDKGYKMYYISVGCEEGVYLSVIESSDGITWTRPELNIYPPDKVKAPNRVLKVADNMFVYYDTTPDCPKSEKYKAIGSFERKDKPGSSELRYFHSEDGYHFEDGGQLYTDGHFDTLNTIIFKDGKYSIYFRSFHDKSGNNVVKWDNTQIRDIRVTHSDNFKVWSQNKRITFTDTQDYPLYTNNVCVYPRAPHMLVGFPVRYCERQAWTANEEQMESAEIKKASMEKHEKRAGLTVTDCIFMCSRNGEVWRRFNEAFMTPGYEEEHNWVYGDCYASYGFVDSGKETYYMYTIDRHRSEGYPKPLNRYEIRKDGFAGYMADGEERVIVTKPLIFSGSELHLNFSTSAFGYIFAEVLDENGISLSHKESFEIYGDTIDRKISFSDGTDFSEYAGKPVRLKFRMRDAKIFSLMFE